MANKSLVSVNGLLDENDANVVFFDLGLCKKSSSHSACC